jgi:superfamily II DNA or RNA helicase
VIKVATGGGKTVIGAAIIAKLNVKTLFIVNSLDLLEQTHDEFVKMLKIDIGKIGGGFCDIQKINVCTIQTLHSALGLKYEAVDEECYIEEKIEKSVLERKGEIRKLIETCDMIFIDECQHQQGSSYVNMMKHAKRAYFKFGASATPYRLESTDILLDAFSGKLITNITASYLIERGFLVAPKIYFLDPNLLGKYKYVRNTSFTKMYQKWIVENNNRNKLISDCAERLLELNKTVLITVTRIEHGERVMDLLLERIPGIKTAFMRGEVHKDERKRLLNEIREKKLNVLVGTSVADEGLDLPALDSAIMGGGGKSLIKSLQRVGRTLRPYPSAENNIKKEAIIIDFWDHLRYLTGQSVKRMKIYSSERLFQVLKHF